MTSRPFLVPPGAALRLADHDPADIGAYPDKAQAEGKIREDRAALAACQDLLQANERHALLVLFQGMDGSGKDEAIEHVLSGLDPHACRARNFKQPEGEEAKHDYLWRFVAQLPQRGQIVAFNRSYYEEVLSSRVHPERLDEQNLTDPPATAAAARKKLWRQRFAQINHFERYLVENGTLVVKFFLNVSKEKQCERLLERIERPEEQWQFSMDDIEDRGHWDEYQHAYEEALRHTSTSEAPWHIIPGDHRWFSALCVAEILVATLRSLGLEYPKPDGARERELSEAQKLLERE